MITVEGERVPLAEVLAALTLDHEHLILPSGLFVRTDRPEFAQLYDIVRAAAELEATWRPLATAFAAVVARA